MKWTDNVKKLSEVELLKFLKLKVMEKTCLSVLPLNIIKYNELFIS